MPTATRATAALASVVQHLEKALEFAGEYEEAPSDATKNKVIASISRAMIFAERL